ncbi:hypothetical protein AD946_09045 [Gluconobacter thailandicus]|nr:hypothetical protein AD946_09045 [Gluconobacter thailandicus]
MTFHAGTVDKALPFNYPRSSWFVRFAVFDLPSSGGSGTDRSEEITTRLVRRRPGGIPDDALYSLDGHPIPKMAGTRLCAAIQAIMSLASGAVIF